MKIIIRFFVITLFLLCTSFITAKLTHLQCAEDYKKLSRDGKATVARFHARWCDACKVIDNSFKQLAQETTNIDFVDIDIDEFPELTIKEKIQGVPAFVYLRDGQVIGKTIGINTPEEFKDYMRTEIQAKLGVGDNLEWSASTFFLFLNGLWYVLSGIRYLLGF